MKKITILGAVVCAGFLWVPASLWPKAPGAASPPDFSGVYYPRRKAVVADAGEEIHPPARSAEHRRRARRSRHRSRTVRRAGRRTRRR